MASSSVKCSTGVPADDSCRVLSSSTGVDTGDVVGWPPQSLDLPLDQFLVQMTLGEWPLDHPPEQ